MTFENLEDRMFVGQQINRLKVLKRPPTGEEAMQDYATTLARCETRGILEATIDEFVFHGIDCPKPAELLDVIHRNNEAYREGQIEARARQKRNNALEHVLTAAVGEHAEKRQMPRFAIAMTANRPPTIRNSGKNG